MTFVYFAHCEQVGATKIGKADDVRKRLTSLQIGSPLPLQLVDTLQDDSGRLEAALHQWFASKRIRGEWFRITPDDVREVAAMVRERGAECLSPPQQTANEIESAAEQLRQAIEQCPMSRYAICQATGDSAETRIRESVLARFMAGGGITLDTAERLAAAIDCRLVVADSPSK